jgi:hypothetical protein
MWNACQRGRNGKLKLFIGHKNVHRTFNWIWQGKSFLDISKNRVREMIQKKVAMKGVKRSE